jgi:hypothetical protein
VLLKVEVNLGPSGKTGHLPFSHPASSANHSNGDQDQAQDKEDGQYNIYDNSQVRTCYLNKERYSDEESDHEKGDDRDHGSNDGCPVIKGRWEFHLVKDMSLDCPKILKERKIDNQTGTNTLYLKSLWISSQAKDKH